jgi:hypothetical protein
MMNKFVSTFKKDMAQYYNTSEDQIIVQSITKGSLLIDFYYKEDERRPFSQLLSLKGRLLKEERLFNSLQLTSEDFDSKGDIDFITQHTAKEQVRGFFPYYQPSGWVRYGLNVAKYHAIDGGSDSWLKMNGNPKEWAVMYHGVRDPIGEVKTTITKTTVTKAIVYNSLKTDGCGQAR